MGFKHFPMCKLIFVVQGRRHVEAMSMGLPVIATNWSGTTEFMNTSNAFPIELDGFDEIPTGAFRGLSFFLL